MHRVVWIVCFILCVPLFAKCTVIVGSVTDRNSGRTLSQVYIQNIHNSRSALTDSNGAFSIEVEKGQLLEFRKPGYKLVRVRIPSGDIPGYFKITMQEGSNELSTFELAGKSNDWATDSARYARLYKTALDFPALEGIDVIQHPFSALSKRNRQIWAFQKEYDYWQKEKYVDYRFNEKTIQTLTGLQGDSLRIYSRRYRPSYDEVRSMNDYELYRYIRQRAILFRKKYVPSIRRSAH